MTFKIPTANAELQVGDVVCHKRHGKQTVHGVTRGGKVVLDDCENYSCEWTFVSRPGVWPAETAKVGWCLDCVGDCVGHPVNKPNTVRGCHCVQILGFHNTWCEKDWKTMNNEEPLKQIESQLAEAIESAQMFLREMTKALAERDAAVARVAILEHNWQTERTAFDEAWARAEKAEARAEQAEAMNTADFHEEAALREQAERERDEARALVRKLNAAEIYPSDCDDIVDKWGDI